MREKEERGELPPPVASQAGPASIGLGKYSSPPTPVKELLLGTLHSCSNMLGEIGSPIGVQLLAPSWPQSPPREEGLPVRHTALGTNASPEWGEAAERGRETPKGADTRRNRRGTPSSLPSLERRPRSLLWVPLLRK